MQTKYIAKRIHSLLAEEFLIPYQEINKSLSLEIHEWLTNVRRIIHIILCILQYLFRIYFILFFILFVFIFFLVCEIIN